MRNYTFLLLLMISFSQAVADAPGLKAGFASRNLISQIKGIPLAGYGQRLNLPSQGVHDPIYAKFMVLETPETRMAIITLDLIGVNLALRNDLQRIIPEGVPLQPDHVILAATHTHAGYGALSKSSGNFAMDTLVLATCGPFNQRLYEEFLEKLRSGLAEAWRDRAPAKLGVGLGKEDRFHYNRGRKGGVTDPDLYVVKITDPKGKLRGVLVNYAAHPTCTGSENLLVSADYPGAFQRAFEKAHPGATAMFTNGAVGDQGPRCPDKKRKGFDKAEQIGKLLAERVDALQKTIRCDVAVSIGCRTKMLDMPNNDRDWFKQMLSPRRSCFHQITFGDTLIMSLPGEPCAQIGLNLKAAAKKRGFKHAMIMGLCGDYCGYFVHRDDYKNPGSHGYEKSQNFYGPDVVDFFLRVHMKSFRPKKGS
ncbi:MAG: neutral/alkaline non-lysosomal ceramidase N-terminal domain-containing protein [Phycisphaerae bacterium]|nr:neutral/alkaline non-lysosomal ceramidase N-terminal domain-containing protein [Phycisphaerae bacterium]